MTPDRPLRSRFHGSADEQAAAWLARRDRGLTPREQDDYLVWLHADGRHPAALARAEAALRRLLRLAVWQPEHSAEPNPDLLAPPRRRAAWLRPAFAAAAAVALVAGGLFFRRAFPPPAPPAPSYLRVNERLALPDGSLVELKDGSRLDVQFTPALRRVRLGGGEAHFTVAKNPARPFVVEAGGVAVRAVGTAFNVRLEPGSVEILVTEGRVTVSPPGTPGESPLVAAGQLAVISLLPVPAAAPAPVPMVASVSPAQQRAALAWQAPRLQFFETPLAEVVAEFNRHNRRQLLLGEAALGAVPIGGTFRVDNVEGFVRLLESAVGVRAEERAGETVLTRAR